MHPSRALPHVIRGALVALVATALVVPATPAAEAGITRPFKAKVTRQLSPGIVYQKGTMRTTGGRIQSVRVATVDGMHPAVQIKSLLSNDRVIKKERPSKLADRKSRPGSMAMVATNGDRSVFGRLDAYAAPHSMQISGREVMVVQACTRPTLGIDSSGRARIDDVRVHVSATLPGRSVAKQIHRVNTHRDDAKTVLFTKRFGYRTKTAPGGIEVVLSMQHRLLANDTQAMKVVAVRRGAGNSRLRWGQAVLSVKGTKNRWVRDLRVGQTLRISTELVRNVKKSCGGEYVPAQGWDDVVEAIGGNHFTARNGRVAAPSAAVYRPSVQRHPRTGVGVTADGRVLMATVDGRQAGYSIGVTLAEMGRLLTSLGAVHAFNFDGGGSTVMAKRNLRTGRFTVANRPSDGRERVHSGALAAFAITE